MTVAAAVVVPSWNGRTHLARCLPALAAQMHRPAEVVVVDNGSRDGTAAWLAETHPGVRLVDLGRNAGFAAACNAGIAATSAPWVAILNNDTRPEPAWLGELTAAAEADPRVAAVASLMVFMDAPGTVNSAGIAVDASGIAWDRLGGQPASAAAGPAVVFGASAGAGLFRREALLDAAEVGPDGAPAPFDDRYFMFMEDVDLAWRLRLRGWRAAYAPRAVVAHAGSATAVEGSAFKNRLLARNKIWTVVKDYPTGPLVLRLPLILSYDLGSAPYRLLAQRQAAALLGRMEAVRRIAPVLRQRRRVQARRAVGWPELSAALAPLEAPWRVPDRYRHLAGRTADMSAAAPASPADRESPDRPPRDADAAPGSGAPPAR